MTTAVNTVILEYHIYYFDRHLIHSAKMHAVNQYYLININITLLD